MVDYIANFHFVFPDKINNFIIHTVIEESGVKDYKLDGAQIIRIKVQHIGGDNIDVRQSIFDLFLPSRIPAYNKDGRGVYKVYKYPRKFSDVAHLYLGLRGRVSFDTASGHKNFSSSAEDPGDPELAIGQLNGIFKLMGRTSNKRNINEMLLELEQIILQQFI